MNEITFFTPARLNELWEFMRILLKFASPSVLIWVAITGVGFLLTIVVVTFKRAANNDDDDDDYDVKYY